MFGSALVCDRFSCVCDTKMSVASMICNSNGNEGSHDLFSSGHGETLLWRDAIVSV